MPFNSYNYKLNIKQKRMSITLQSDDETIDESNLTNIQVLIKENKIKDLALSKATSLIELLSVELQVERSNKEEAARQVQEQLRVQFSKQLEGMKQKIELLQRQLKRCNALAATATNVKTKRQASLSRSDSNCSLEGKRKKTKNKKYTENNSQEGIDQGKKLKIQVAFLEDHFTNIQTWKQTVVDQLNEIVNNDYAQLQELLAKLESRYSVLDDVFSEPASSSFLQVMDDLQMSNRCLEQIVSEQKVIINQLKLYIQDIEDIFKHCIYKMGSNSRFTDGNLKHFDIHQILVDLKLRVSQGKKNLANRVYYLQEENIELKNILDNMIKLVQNERKIHF